MRDDWSHLNRYRVQMPGLESPASARYGVFVLSRLDEDLRMIATDGDYEAAGLPPEYGWEHVSVSTATRCPTWDEMAKVKSLFWADDETVMQLHVPKAQHINCHPYTLHLWRPKTETIPLPPGDTVGIKP